MHMNTELCVGTLLLLSLGSGPGGEVLNDAISIAQELLTLIPLNFHRPWVPLAYYPPDPPGRGSVEAEGFLRRGGGRRCLMLGAQWQRSSEALASGTPGNV